MVKDREHRGDLKFVTKCVRRLVRRLGYGRVIDVNENHTYKNDTVMFRLGSLWTYRPSVERIFTKLQRLYVCTLAKIHVSAIHRNG